MTPSRCVRAPHVQPRVMEYLIIDFWLDDQRLPAGMTSTHLCPLSYKHTLLCVCVHVCPNTHAHTHTHAGGRKLPAAGYRRLLSGAPGTLGSTSQDGRRARPAAGSEHESARARRARACTHTHMRPPPGAQGSKPKDRAMIAAPSSSWMQQRARARAHTHTHTRERARGRTRARTHTHAQLQRRTPAPDLPAARHVRRGLR